MPDSGWMAAEKTIDATFTKDVMEAISPLLPIFSLVDCNNHQRVAIIYYL